MITDKEIADNVIKAYKKQLIHAVTFEQEDYTLSVLKDCLGRTDEDLKKDMDIARKALKEAGAKQKSAANAAD